MLGVQSVGVKIDFIIEGENFVYFQKRSSFNYNEYTNVNAMRTFHGGR